MFVAHDLVAEKAAREPGEEIEICSFPGTRRINMAVNGTIRDANTIAALLVCDRQGLRR